MPRSSKHRARQVMMDIKFLISSLCVVQDGDVIFFKFNVTSTGKK